MKPSACLSPIRIYNKVLHTYMHVPCGHCPACQVIKGYRRSEKVNAAFNTFHYRYFVTLTYRDETLPLARFYEDRNVFESDDCDYNGELYHVSLNSECVKQSKDFILDCVKQYGGVPVLSHSDVIKFKKRLRKNIYERLGYYPPIFFFNSGEYGPLHYRPHHHLCIGFNERGIQGIFRECVHKAWTMFNKYSAETDLRLIGKVDIQAVVGNGCPNYCAQYLNCVTNLPSFLGKSCFRPFSSKTCTSDFELRRTGNDDVREVFNRCSITETFIDSQTKKECTSLCGNLYKNRYFPKCPSFGSLSHYERVALYRVYERYFSQSCNFEETSPSATKFAEFVLNERDNRFYSSTNTMRLLHLVCCVGDEFQTINKLKRLFYVSRRVFFNSCACGVSVETYVSRIEEFYQKIELDRLKRFYQSINDMMDDFYNPLPLSKVFHLYYDTSPSISHFQYYKKQFGCEENAMYPQFLPAQIDYACKMNKIALDNTKTKKRNDDFEHRGLEPLHYLFMPTKAKQKFINHF